MENRSANTIRRCAFAALLVTLALGSIAVTGYKLYVLDYPVSALMPAQAYRVELSMDLDGYGNGVNISTYLPKSDSRQIIHEERNSSGEFTFMLHSEALNRRVSWNAQDLRGRHNVRYSYSVQLKHIRYVIPVDLPIPENYPEDFDVYLKTQQGIQVKDPLIGEKLKELFKEKPSGLLEALSTIHRDLQDNFRNRNFSGYTDAITALKLGEASCNGKGRLFVALARRLNIPARLVGGLILRPGTKRLSHQWVEAYVNGHWVPFDTINDHFAEIPENFLTLYYGDEVLFKHTADINFGYFFKIRKLLAPKREALAALRKSPLNIVNLYEIFDRVGISQNLLKIILMIPLGALVTVIFRNVIGVETFGTFLPALIAAASRETGLLWGAAGFVLIILVSYAVRKALEWMQLLHSPKMAVMLTTVVVAMMTMTVLGVRFGLFDLAHVSLFPIALLAITAERFAIIEMEQGPAKAVKMLLMTLAVVAACYAVMDSLFMQSLMLAFPELLFFIIALNLWIGKWMGIRVLEFVRFRKLLIRAAE